MMKKLVFLAVGLLLNFYLLGQTEVSGLQSGKWDGDGSPYQVTGNITIPTGKSLVIDPGVKVDFKGHYQLIVKGQLQAIGNKTDSIFFTTDNQELGWGGIRVSSGDLCELSYCRISFGKTGLNHPDNVGGALALFNSNAHVSNCVFADNNANGDDDGFGGAVYGINLGAGNEATRFEDCIFLRNYAYGEGGAIKLSNDLNTEIIGCDFIGNNAKYGGGAIAFYGSGNASVTRSLFTRNYTVYSNGGAVVALGYGNTLSFKNCTFAHNSANGGEGGGINLVNTKADFVNTIIYENPGKYGDDLFLSSNGEAEVNYCNLKMPDDATGNNNIEETPLFVDSDNLNYHLQSSSPCIDAGTDIGLPFAGDAPDMGYFENGLVSGLELAQKMDIQLYPNPTIQHLTIKNTHSFNEVQIVNIFGTVVLSQDMATVKSVKLDLPSLVGGVYFLQLLENHQIISSGKFIVE